MNFLILCHSTCSYLILPNELQLPLSKRLEEILSDNLIATMSGHLQQFLIAPIFLPMLQTKKAIYLKVIVKVSIM